MPFSVKKNQYLTFSFLLVFAMATMVTLYHGTQQRFILFHRAVEMNRSGAMEQGTEMVRQALALGFDQVPATIRLAEEYLAVENYEMAGELYQNMLSRHPEDGSLVYHLSLILSRQGRTGEAIALYGKYSKTWKKLPEAYFHLADLHQGRQDFAKAVALYRIGLILAPDNVTGKLHLAETLSWMQQYKEAIDLYREVLTSQSNLRQARLALARVLSWSGMQEEAIREYRIVLGDLQ
jgi:tetratricopeptide (TPR) repeat protein